MIEPLIDEELIVIAGLNRKIREVMMIVHPSRWSLLLLGLVMAGCESGGSLGPVSPAEQQALIESAATTSPNLHPGEKIRVIVFGEDRLSGEFEIDPAGFVSLPLAGTIKAAGLSKQQLEQDLSKKFSGEYLRDPRVTVDIVSFRPFYIMGEVAKAGEYPFKSGLNVMSAIAIAGGTTYRANRSTVLIQHIGENGFREYPLLPTIPVSPGDLIRVPERYF
jgi:protein involved in polysaccharide export with SLBB domain